MHDARTPLVPTRKLVSLFWSYRHCHCSTARTGTQDGVGEERRGREQVKAAETSGDQIQTTGGCCSRSTFPPGERFVVLSLAYQNKGLVTLLCYVHTVSRGSGDTPYTPDTRRLQLYKVFIHINERYTSYNVLETRRDFDVCISFSAACTYTLSFENISSLGPFSMVLLISVTLLTETSPTIDCPLLYVHLRAHSPRKRAFRHRRKSSD